MFIFACVLFGFLGLRLWVLGYNWVTRPLLPRSTAQPDEFVSVLIPARNEAANIGQTLAYITAQDYPNYEVIVLDDGSTDGTAEIVAAAAATNPRIRCVQGEPLPAQWLGKNWACHQLGQIAAGDYLLFTDADVQLKNGLIAAALTEMKKRNLTVLSIFPDQDLGTWGEKVVVPMMHYILLTLLPLVWIRQLPFPSMAAANGQFLLFNAAAYTRFGFHAEVKSRIAEDIAIVQYAKSQRLKAQTYLGNDLVRCRMYHSYTGAMLGFSKNMLEGFGNSAIGLAIFLVLVFFGFVPVLFTYPSLSWVLLGGVMLQNFMLAQLSRQSWFMLLLTHFPRMCTFVCISVLSVYKKLTRTNQWKGRNITLK